MKIFKFLGYPIFVCISFLCIMISGEHTGGLYLFYIIMGLPYGAVHSVLGLIGVIILISSTFLVPLESKLLTRSIIKVLGLGLLIFSLFLFFGLDKTNYNHGTFSQSVPLVSLFIFAVAIICFIIFSLVRPLAYSARKPAANI